MMARGESAAARPLRWLLLTQDFPPVPGGMSSYYYNLLLASAPGEAAVIAPRAEVGHDDGAVPFPVRRLGRGAKQLRTQADLLLATRSVRRHVREIDPAALVVGNFRPFGYVARKLGLPYLPVFHGLDLMRLVERGATSALRRRMYAMILRGAAGFIVNTEFTGSLLGEHFAAEIAGRRVSILRPGIDLARFRPQPPSGRPLLLTVARYAERKGIDTVIRAMPAVLERIPEAIYRVVGHGDRSPYAALAESLGVAHAVDLRGPVPDGELARHYGESALFVMVPRALEGGTDVEGFGMVYLEAGACRRPVVASRSGGVPEAVADGESGLLVAPDDPAATAAAILRLLEDQAFASLLAERGRRRAESGFAWPGQVARLREIIAETIAP